MNWESNAPLFFLFLVFTFCLGDYNNYVEIYISNDGGSLTAEQVNIELPINIWYANGMVKENCMDVLFSYDNDGKSPIDFWMESCYYNTEKVSTFWIEVDLLEGLNTIYVLYNDSTKAEYPDSALVFSSGNFLVGQKDSTCPIGYSSSDLNNYDWFIASGESYDDTMQKDGGEISHSHTAELTFATGVGETLIKNNQNSPFSSSTHTHASLTVDLSSVNNNPRKVLNLPLCEGSLFQLKKNQIIMFYDGVPTSSDWSSMNDDYNGMFLRFSDLFAAIINEQMIHTINTESNEGSGVHNDGKIKNYSVCPLENHIHYISADLDESLHDIFPPHIIIPMGLCLNHLSNDINGVMLFATGVPPLGWDLLEVDDSKLIKIGSTLDLSENGYDTHDHGGTHSAISTNSTIYEQTYCDNSGTASGYSTITHTHSVSVSGITESNNIPEYKKLLIIKRKDETQLEYNLTYPAESVECGENCDKCVNELICSECSQNYDLKNGKCVEHINCSTNCDDCNQTTCFYCVSGYHVSDNLWDCARDCSSHCSDCNNTDCLTCQSDYHISKTNPWICELDCSSTCSECNDTQCLECMEGYKIKSSNPWLCEINCSNNCETCNLMECLECIDGYEVKESNPWECDIKCSENCNICNETTCLSCFSGYQILENDAWECELICSDNCGICNKTACLNCSNGHKISSTNPWECVLNCSDNCKSCNLTKCIECNEGYKANESDPRECDIICSENCDSCDEEKCTACSIGYTPADDEWNCEEECSDNCIECDNKYVCTKCENGYHIVLTSFHSICQEDCIPHCINCVDNTTCESCDDGYDLENNTCKISCLENCEECESSDICIKCKENYEISSDNTTCTLQCISNCLECKTTSDCTVCSEGYFLSEVGGNIVCTSTGTVLGVVFGVSGFTFASCVLIGFILFSALLFIYLVKNRREQKELLYKVQNNMQMEEIESKVFNEKVAKLNINESLFKIKLKELEVLKLLEKGGGSASIFLVSWQNKKCVFKCFNTSGIFQNQYSFQEFEHEVSILCSVHHPHILEFFGAVCEAPKVGIVMAYAKHGDLKSFLVKFKRVKKKKYPKKEKIRILIEIATAMGYLHSRKIIHRDLKLENVLISDKFQAKVMDFGISKFLKELDHTSTQRIGTPIYMAPEVVLGGKYNAQCDVFSFGILGYMMITEEYEPYRDDEGNVITSSIEMKVANNPQVRPNLKDEKRKIDPEWLAPILSKCWNHDPLKRPEFCDLINEITINAKEDEDVEFKGEKKAHTV